MQDDGRMEGGKSQIVKTTRNLKQQKIPWGDE